MEEATPEAKPGLRRTKALPLLDDPVSLLMRLHGLARRVKDDSPADRARAVANLLRRHQRALPSKRLVTPDQCSAIVQLFKSDNYGSIEQRLAEVVLGGTTTVTEAKAIPSENPPEIPTREADPTSSADESRPIIDQLRRAAEDGSSIDELDELGLELSDRLSTEVAGRTATLTALLAKISIRTAQTELIKNELVDIVEEARSLGASWPEIAQAAGVISSSAQRRWDPEARRRHREYQKSRYRSPDSD